MDGGRVALVGEAKWSDRPAGPRAIEQLRTTLTGIPGADPASTRLALFSRSGFSDQLRALAERESIVLVTLVDMYADA